jgi:EAL domain-containing protein (putative c-di-GMP-specific phosphodiesterase class I)
MLFSARSYQNGGAKRDRTVDLYRATVALSQLSYSPSTLEALKELGLSVAIDDFGTGHSSLAYLKRYPVDTLKIDRSFVIDITTNSSDQAIARSIIALAQAMELNVLAEDV